MKSQQWAWEMELGRLQNAIYKERGKAGGDLPAGGPGRKLTQYSSPHSFTQPIIAGRGGVGGG